MEWYLIVLKKYVTWQGRARPKEYWMYTLINLIIAFALGFLDAAVIGTNGILGLIYALAVFLPGISVTVRRLHDTNRSGWWFWIVLIPLIGIFVLLYFVIVGGTRGSNDYGEDPISSEGMTATQ